MIKDERGIAIVEILVALVIAGLITGTLVTAIYQIYQVTGWGNNELRVQHNLQNAATWLNRDVVSASSAEVNGSQMVLTIPYYPSGSFIYTPTIRTITYTFSAAERILARDSVTSTVTVARYIVSNPFPSPAGTITSTITITLASQAGDVTRSATLHLDMRPEPTPTPTTSP